MENNTRKKEFIKLHTCSYCKSSKKGIMKCSRCKTSFYCSKECQTNDYKKHKFTCFEISNDVDLIRKNFTKVWTTIKKNNNMSEMHKRILCSIYVALKNELIPTGKVPQIIIHSKDAMLYLKSYQMFYFERFDENFYVARLENSRLFRIVDSIGEMQVETQHESFIKGDYRAIQYTLSYLEEGVKKFTSFHFVNYIHLDYLKEIYLKSTK